MGNKKPQKFSRDEFARLVHETHKPRGFRNRIKYNRLVKRITTKFEKYRYEAKEYLKDGRRLEELLLRVEKHFREVPHVGEGLAFIPQLVLLTRSYYMKEYTDISAVEIVAIIAALIYFVSPIDAIPDFLNGVGWLDDAIVAGIVVKWCKDDIDKYMKWLEEKNESNV